MLGRQLRVVTVFGIPIKIDSSWLLIVFLVAASMTVAFGQDYPYLRVPARLSMGLSAALLLFASVLAHELAHAVVAIRAGVSIRGITLFIFGGAAEMGEEPSKAVDEFMIAVAGPLMSLVLAISFFASSLAAGAGLPEPFVGLFRYLALMNAILVAFNLIPGFPLDGGRVLRALLWGLWDSYSAATRVASAVGGFFGGVIVFLGLFYLLAFGNWIGGIWFVFIGMFLRGSARAGYHQMLLKGLFQGVRASDLMSANLVSVEPSEKIAVLMDRYPLPMGITEWLVVEDGKLLGVVRQLDAMRLSPESRENQSASELMHRDVLKNALLEDDDAARCLPVLAREDRLVPVLANGELRGVITRRMLQRHMEAGNGNQ